MNLDGSFHGCVSVQVERVFIHACTRPQPCLCYMCNFCFCFPLLLPTGATDKGRLTSGLLPSLCGGQHGVLFIGAHSVNRPSAPACQQGPLEPVRSWLRPCCREGPLLDEKVLVFCLLLMMAPTFLPR